MREVLYVKFAILIGLGLAFITIEWMAGCGEVTYFEDHTWQTNECVFIDREIKHGTW